MGRPALVVGSWPSVSSGCSVQSTGDWAAHFNTGTSNSATIYTPVCINLALGAAESAAATSRGQCAVWAQTDADQVGPKAFDDAQSYCTSRGARLCTAAELEAN
jgi:hypothetical protein